MSDLERDLRELLDQKAAGAGVPIPDPRLVTRARRRQLGTAVGGVLVVAALLGGVALAVATLGGSDGHTPADALEPSVETTVNGVSVLHPASWSVVDPVVAGIQPASDTLPQLILLLTTEDPITPEAIGCPGLAGGRSDGLVMTIQEEPFALAGEAARPWPVELVPLDTGNVGEDEIEPSGCYAGWTFLRASWSQGGRTFEARVGFGPDVSEADREALGMAFSSMRSVPTQVGPEAVVVATGTTAGEEWQLIATGGQDGLQLGLEWSAGGAGTGGFADAPDDVHLSSSILGEGERRELVVFGAVPADVVRVEVVEGLSPIDVEIVDVPDALDPRWNAVVFTADLESRIVVDAYDAAGRSIGSAEVGPGSGEPVETQPSAEPDEVLFRGRTNECFWTLARWSEGSHRERLELSQREGGASVGLVVDTSLGAPPLQLASFDCPGDGSNAVLVFGIATDDVADVQWTDPLGADGGPPECIASTLPSRLCVVLGDFSGPGEAIAIDADGGEIGRVPY